MTELQCGTCPTGHEPGAQGITTLFGSEVLDDLARRAPRLLQAASQGLRFGKNWFQISQDLGAAQCSMAEDRWSTYLDNLKLADEIHYSIAFNEPCLVSLTEGDQQPCDPIAPGIGVFVSEVLVQLRGAVARSVLGLNQLHEFADEVPAGGISVSGFD